MADSQSKTGNAAANAAITELESICNLLRTRSVQHAMQNEAIVAECDDLKSKLKAASEEIETLKVAQVAQPDGV